MRLILIFIVGIGDEADNQTFVLAIVGHPTNSYAHQFSRIAWDYRLDSEDVCDIVPDGEDHQGCRRGAGENIVPEGEENGQAC